MLNVFERQKPIIGMVNLKTMPGYPGFKDIKTVLSSALVDAKALIEGGIDGILVENSFDFPPRSRDRTGNGCHHGCDCA